VAPGKRGLKRGLSERQRTVILMLDETIITETPPLTSCYGPKGQQVCVPITGNHARRVVHGALNIGTGALLLLITEVWDQATHQYFLTMIRSHWRGWHIVLFEDRGTPHTAEESRALATQLHMELRFLPVATPALQTWPRHPCQQWGLKTTGCARVPDRVLTSRTRLGMLCCITYCSDCSFQRKTSCRVKSRRVRVSSVSASLMS